MINLKLELIILLSSLGEKVMYSPPRLHSTGMLLGREETGPQGGSSAQGGCTAWGQLRSSHGILLIGNNDLRAAQAPDSPGAQPRETGYGLEEKEEKKASGQMFLDNTSCGPAPTDDRTEAAEMGRRLFR